MFSTIKGRYHFMGWGQPWGQNTENRWSYADLLKTPTLKAAGSTPVGCTNKKPLKSLKFQRSRRFLFYSIFPLTSIFALQKPLCP